MEHIIITELANGYRLVPESGYRLYNKVSQQYYSEAIIKKLTNAFVAVAA